MGDMAAMSSITRLLASAAELSDVQLAVTLQSLVSKRPALREVLLNVWHAEAMVAGGTDAGIERALVGHADTSTAAPAVKAMSADAGMVLAGIGNDERQATNEDASPASKIRDLCRRFA